MGTKELGISPFSQKLCFAFNDASFVNFKALLHNIKNSGILVFNFNAKLSLERATILLICLEGAICTNLKDVAYVFQGCRD